MTATNIINPFEINLPRRKEYVHELWEQQQFTTILEFGEFLFNHQIYEAEVFKYILFAHILLLNKEKSIEYFFSMREQHSKFTWYCLNNLVTFLGTHNTGENEYNAQFEIINIIIDHFILSNIDVELAKINKILYYFVTQQFFNAFIEIEKKDNWNNHQLSYFIFIIYMYFGEHEKAIRYFQIFMSENHNFQQRAKFFARELYYIFGEYEVANDYYESRLECYKPLFPHPIKPITAPTTGKKLLVISEGGFGDCFMSCKYIARLQEFGCHLTFAVRPKMIRLAKEMDYVDEIIDLNTINIDEYDFVIYAFSLMKILNINIHNIPSPAVKLKNCLRGEILPPSPFGIKIGIQWKSGMNDHRSLPLAELFAILPTNTTKYNFQFDCNDDEKEFLEGRDDCVNLNPKITDWYDTAHYLQQMDYIVTIDSGIANCASFMGLDEKLYVLLHKNVAAHWYCMKLDYAPQHPGAHRFIQHEYNNWAHPLAECRQALTNRIHTDFHNS